MLLKMMRDENLFDDRRTKGVSGEIAGSGVRRLVKTMMSGRHATEMEA